MRDRTFAPSRMLIYLVVSLVAVAYLVPLIVVVLNSLRSNEEIIQTSMIGWPRQWAFANYLTAWSDFCVAQTCAGIRPYMLNSALVTIPATSSAAFGPEMRMRIRSLRSKKRAPLWSAEYSFSSDINCN